MAAVTRAQFVYPDDVKISDILSTLPFVSDFLEPKAPAWRLTLYGVAGFGVACWIGVWHGSSGLVIDAVIAIPLLILGFLCVARFARSALTSSHLPLIIFIYVIAQLLLLGWDLFLRHE